MEDRGSRIAASGRARGAIVGSLIAFAWGAYGSAIVNDTARYVLVATFALLTAGMVIAAIRQLRLVHRMPPESPAQRAAGRRAWRWFWVNLVAEIVLLNIAVAWLGTERQAYRIAAISAVVGLHFIPMAKFFRVRPYWFVAAAMLTGAVVAALLIAWQPGLAGEIAYLEALLNAAILWAAVGAGVMGVNAVM